MKVKRQTGYRTMLRMISIIAAFTCMGANALTAAEEQPAVPTYDAASETTAASAPAMMAGQTATPAARSQAAGIEQLIRDLKSQGLIDEHQAKALLEKYRGKAVQNAVSEAVDKDELIKDLSDEMGARLDSLSEQVQALSRLPVPKTAPEWTERIKLLGEMRLRYQGDYYDDNNALMLDPNDPDELMNTQSTRNRVRLRARLGAQTAVTDRVQAVIRLSTGDTTQPSSSNSTMGTYFRKSAILVDQAYLKYHLLPELTLWGGRMPNPWFSANLVWDKDLNFDGASLTFDTQLMRPLGMFVTLGAFPVQEVELSAHDKWLYAAQTGLRCNLKDAVTAKVAAAYYHYTNITGRTNDIAYPNRYDWTAPPYLQKGNTLMDIDPTTDYKLALASDYHEINVTGQIDVAVFDPIHVVLSGDYVKNIGFDKDEVAKRTQATEPVEKEIKGYAYSLSVGYPQVSERWQWRCFLTKKHLEADAVLDAFTDTAFHAGGTNCEGHIIGLELGLARNIALGAQYMQSNEISGPQLSVDTLQVDISVRF